MTYAYLTKARSQNVLYTEMFFDPQAHTARGVSYDTVILGIRRAQMEAETSLGIHSQLIMCFLRDWSAEFERHIQIAREQLGAAKFEAVVAEGRAMTMEQAIAYALEISANS